MNPFEWLSQHWLAFTGWTGLAVFLWRVHKTASKIEKYGEHLTTVREDLTVVMSNHLPHVQAELESINQNVGGLRDDVKDGLGRLTDSINVVLTRIQ